MDFKLPDIGEGVHEGEIVKWLVKEGSEVKENDPLVEVMTDKATVEIPSPTTGKIKKIHFEEGQTVEVDTVIVSFEGGEASAVETPAASTTQAAPTPTSSTQAPASGSGGGLATPAVRKLAKDLGVDLSTVTGSGPGGRITNEDIAKAHGGGSKTTSSSAPRFTPQPVVTLGDVERIPVKGIRKTIAHHLQMAKYYAPHFTHVEELDCTALVALRNAKKASAEKKGIKLTYLAYIAKALIVSLKEFPYLNASLDETTNEIILKKYFNIGMAVDTPEGLIVPVIKDADKKSVEEIAVEIVRLASAVRSGKAKPEELKGSSFTLTSIGSIGGVFATPILNYPDVAIMAVNKIEERPVVIDGKVEVRHMMYLALTLDHRVVDGAVAARFLNHLIATLQNPESLS